MLKKTTEAVNTVVGKGSVLQGHFDVADGIRVDGELSGRLTTSGALVVGVSGKVDAEPIRVKDAIVAGEVKGSIEATHLVKLEASANVVGDITAQVLIIEEGAILQGVCDTRPEQNEETIQEKPLIEAEKAMG